MKATLEIPAALSFYEEQRQSGNPLFISDLVLSECYYALKFHFGFTKADALAALKALTAESPVTITPSARLVFGLPNLSQMKPGFIDRLIHRHPNTRIHPNRKPHANSRNLDHLPKVRS